MFVASPACGPVIGPHPFAWLWPEETPPPHRRCYRTRDLFLAQLECFGQPINMYVSLKFVVDTCMMPKDLSCAALPMRYFKGSIGGVAANATYVLISCATSLALCAPVGILDVYPSHSQNSVYPLLLTHSSACCSRRPTHVPSTSCRSRGSPVKSSQHMGNVGSAAAITASKVQLAS